jgi:phospholipid transport system substrate-binding protein
LRRWFRSLLVLGLAVALPSLAAGPSPQQMVKASADELLVVVNSRRAELEANPARLHQIVDEVLRPNFDVVYSARLVLGRYWPRSTPEQRQRFTQALYRAMVRRYSAGLLKYHEDSVHVEPHAGLIRLDEEFVTVNTKIRTAKGVMVPVNYRTRWSDNSWKVFDVTIEGLSYVASFRDSIGNDVRRKGLDAVIRDLEKI